MRFAREAWPFVVPFLLLSGGLLWFGQALWAVVAGLTALAVLLFFRDPRRFFDGPPEIVLSPAGGTVTQIDEVAEETMGAGRFRRVVTFLSVFDVHVQKVPVSGTVIVSRFSPGKKRAAFVKDVDRVNENHLTVIQQDNGDRVGIRQIAGLVARRVVCRLQPQQSVSRGDALGLIKFGSRVDLLVPPDYEILVEVGDRVANGLTPMARPGSGAVARHADE